MPLLWLRKENFETDESLRIKTHRRKENRCGPDCFFFMRLCAVHRHTILTMKKKLFERDKFLHLKTHKHVSFSFVYEWRTDSQF